MAEKQEGGELRQRQLWSCQGLTEFQSPLAYGATSTLLCFISLSFSYSPLEKKKWVVV